MTFHLSEWLSPKSLQIANIDKDIKKRELPYTAGENVNWWATVENSIKLGANAIIGIDVDYEVLGEKNGMLMVSVSGTAVVVK